MDKEEQIKRLAQNLFSNGFTTSMDYAIQTAAKMLGFPDSMLANGNQTGSSNSQRNTPRTNLTNPSSTSSYESYESFDFSRDMARTISQKMVEDRVYSQIPKSIHSAVSGNSGFSASSSADTSVAPTENIGKSQSEPNVSEDIFVSSSSSQDTQYSMGHSATPFVETTGYNTGYNTGNNTDDNAGNTITNNSEMQDVELTEELDLSDEFSSANTIHDLSVSNDSLGVKDESRSQIDENNENFIENDNVETMPEWNEEEQTSLISGYMDSSSSEEKSFTDDNTENIFKGDVHKEMVMQQEEENNNRMSIDSTNIVSRYEAEFEVDEDFFASALANNDNSGSYENHSEQDVQRQESIAQVSNVSSSQSSPGNSSSEPSIDLTKMFDFRNMKN